MREFDTGAARDGDEDKLDYEACLSPLVLRRYAEFVRANRKQADGTMRPDDGWQKGVPLSYYMKSMWRHLMALWTIHRTVGPFDQEGLDEALCAIIFNSSGYLHEILKRQASAPGAAPGSADSEPHHPSSDEANAFDL